ncbi:hypothetical protein N9260_02235 [bacterium]|nr:hypothetical protein [bacterium]
MKPIKSGDRQRNKEDERNDGITEDELVGISGGFMMRVVTYVDPKTAKE